MKKEIVAITVAFFIMFAACPVFSANRFYNGIGIQVGEISDSTRSIESGHERYNNNYGQLSGHIMVMGVLEGSTAQKAGLKFGNLILAVDGMDVQNMGEFGIINAIKSGNVGSRIIFTIRRIAGDGTPLEDLDIAVDREAVDTTKWLPMNSILGGSVSAADAHITVESKYTEDITEGVFVFWYRVHNKDNQKIFLQWDILDCAANLGRHQRMLLISLDANEAKEFTLKTSNLLAPAYEHGLARVLVHTSKQEIEQYAKKNFFMPENGIQDVSMASSMYAFIPEGWMEECRRIE